MWRTTVALPAAPRDHAEDNTEIRSLRHALDKDIYRKPLLPQTNGD